MFFIELVPFFAWISR